MWVYTLFPKILNMSLTASLVILCVLAARLLFKQAPRVISYALWAVVLFRLLCPVSITSDISLFSALDVPISETGSIDYIPSDIVHTENPAVQLPVPILSETINGTLPQGGEQLSADPLEFPMALAASIWLMGICGLLGYSLFQLLRLCRRLVGAVPLRGRIYLADHIVSPFVLGLIHPKIYLPSTLSIQEQSYIILHEECHLHRGDHIFKILAFAALCIHWFNPLVWLAFILAGKDMEMSCDEAVMHKMGSHIRADYAQSLLRLSTDRSTIAATPLAFCEGDTKSRIKNILNYKKPALGVTVAALPALVILAALLVCNPSQHIHMTIIEDTGTLSETENAWLEENRLSGVAGATVMQTKTGYLLYYRGATDLYGYYTAKAAVKNRTLQIQVQAKFAVSEQFINDTLLARVEIDTAKVDGVSVNIDGSDLTLETVEGGPVTVQQPTMLYFYNALFVLSSDPLELDTADLTQVGKIDSVVPSTTLPQTHGEANRNLIDAPIYENDGRSLIVLMNGSYRLFRLTTEFELYSQLPPAASEQAEAFAQQ